MGMAESQGSIADKIFKIILNASGPLGLGATLLGWVTPVIGGVVMVIGFSYVLWELLPYLRQFVKRSPKMSLAVFVLSGAFLGFVCWAALWKAPASTSKSTDATSSSSNGADTVGRISALISEANGIQSACQGIPNSYQTPAHTRADIANAIVNWKQRAESMLSFDSDPRPLQMWQKAILYSTPEKVPSIALYCTELNVKIDILNRIWKRKTITVEQRIGQLSRFISEGNSIKQACLDGDKLMDTQESEWMIRVMQWLGDNFDDNYAQDFNHAIYPAAQMPGTHPPEIVAVWKRMQGRIDVLSSIRQELAKPLAQK